jgi:hypothetical protein
MTRPGAVRRGVETCPRMGLDVAAQRAAWPSERDGWQGTPLYSMSATRKPGPSRPPSRRLGDRGFAGFCSLRIRTAKIVVLLQRTDEIIIWRLFVFCLTRHCLNKERKWKGITKEVSFPRIFPIFYYCRDLSLDH